MRRNEITSPGAKVAAFTGPRVCHQAQESDVQIPNLGKKILIQRFAPH